MNENINRLEKENQLLKNKLEKALREVNMKSLDILN